MYVCMYVYMYVRVFVCVYVCVCIHTHTYIYFYTYTYTLSHIHTTYRYSDFIAVDTRLRAKYGNRKIDALLAKSRLPGKAFWDKASQVCRSKRHLL